MSKVLLLGNARREGLRAAYPGVVGKNTLDTFQKQTW